MENETDTNREESEKRNPVLRLRLELTIIQRMLRKECDWTKLVHNRDKGQAVVNIITIQPLL
jgi:hypothetical protein